MTDQDWQELGRRAVACKNWRWMPGMLCIPIGGGFPVRYHGIVARNMPSAGGVQYRPDFRDPATLGCLLALVREAYGMPHLTPKMTTSIWRIEDEGAPMKWLIPDLEWAGRFGTEAAALVDALESAGLRSAHP